MADSFKPLKQFVRQQVRRQQALNTTRPKVTPARLLGMFLETALANRGRSRRYFARALDIEAELAEAILEGTLPASEIDDAFLVEIAQVVKHEPNTLRLFLGREIVPAADPASDQPAPPAADEAQSGG